RIAPLRHRRRPRMRLLSRDGDLVPALPLRAGNDTDGLLLVFEDWALLDVRFEIGPDFPSADGLGTGEADAIELRAHADARWIVRPLEPVAEIESSREDP